MDAGKLTARSFVEFRRSTGLLIAHFGKNRVVLDVRPDDFESLYAKLARKHSVASLGREMPHVRSVFRYAVESDLVERVHAWLFGEEENAQQPAKKTERKPRHEKAESGHARPLLRVAG